MYWYQWLFLSLGVWLGGSIIGMISRRANHIYNNKHTSPESMFELLLWPVYIPIYVVEFPAQMLAKYMEFKRKRKLHLNNKVA